jgi:hypothetical protein
MLRPAATAIPAVALESRIPVASEEKRRIPLPPVTGQAQPGDAGVACPQEQNRLRWLPHPVGVIKTRSNDRINSLDRPGGSIGGVRCEVMIALVLAVTTYCRAFFVGRHRLGLEER